MERELCATLEAALVAYEVEVERDERSEGEGDGDALDAYPLTLPLTLNLER